MHNLQLHSLTFLRKKTSGSILMKKLLIYIVSILLITSFNLIFTSESFSKKKRRKSYKKSRIKRSNKQVRKIKSKSKKRITHKKRKKRLIHKKRKRRITHKKRKRRVSSTKKNKFKKQSKAERLADFEEFNILSSKIVSREENHIKNLLKKEEKNISLKRTNKKITQKKLKPKNNQVVSKNSKKRPQNRILDEDTKLKLKKNVQVLRDNYGIDNSSRTIANKKKRKLLALPARNAVLQVSTLYPKQGSTLVLHVKSREKILRCKGNVGGKDIHFSNMHNSQVFRGMVGFDVRHPTEKVKIFVGIMLKSGEVKFLEQEVRVRKKIITPYIWVRKYKTIYITIKVKKKIRYKRRRKWRTKWKVYKKKIPKTIAYKVKAPPPNLAIRYYPKSKEKLQEEIEDDEKNKGGPFEDFGDIDDTKYGERAYVTRVINIKTPIQYWSGNFIQPTYPGRNGRISSKFGAYRCFRLGGRLRRGYHRGLDIAKPSGTPLYAPNHGMVVISKYFGARGNTVIIDHGRGVYSVHIHMRNREVKKGMFVRKGQYIGTVGTTGKSTGPHLHWEIRVNGTSVNSLQWRNYSFK